MVKTSSQYIIFSRKMVGYLSTRMYSTNTLCQEPVLVYVSLYVRHGASLVNMGFLHGLFLLFSLWFLVWHVLDFFWIFC